MKTSTFTGFTLAELIITVAILGFLAALVMGVSSNGGAEANLKTKSANCTQMNELLAQIYDCGGSVNTSSTEAVISDLKNGVNLYNSTGVDVTLALPKYAKLTASSYILNSTSNPPYFTVNTAAKALP